MLLDGRKAVVETSICLSDSYEVVRVINVYVVESACV